MSVTSIQAQTPSPQATLSDIGIQIKKLELTGLAPPVSQAPESPSHQISLKALGPEETAPKVTIKTAQGQALEVDAQLLSKTQLLASFEQVVNHFQLDAALQLEQDVAQVLKALHLTQKQAPLLEISTPNTSLTLETQMLTPEHLHNTFAQALSQNSTEDLKTHHQAFQAFLPRAVSPNPMDSEQYQALFQRDSFDWDTFVDVLKYDPFNEIKSINTLFEDIALASTPAGLNLSQSTLDLMEKAQQLETELELNPTPDSPRVMALFQAFLNILQALDLELRALLKSELSQLKSQRNLLKQFAETLRENLDITQNKRASLSQQKAERVQLFLHLKLLGLNAKAQVAQALQLEVPNLPPKLLQVFAPRA